MSRVNRGKHVASSSSCPGATKRRHTDQPEPIATDHPLTSFEPWLRTSVEKARYNTQKAKPFHPTKFANEGALDALGVKEGVKTMFERVGLGEFFDLHAHTYKGLTLEFLSTLAITTVRWGNVDLPCITFRMYNTQRTMTYDEIRSALHISSRSRYLTPKDQGRFSRDEFWFAITHDSTTPPSYAKESSILHRVLQITHRLIANTILGTTELSKAPRLTLYLLWCMTPLGTSANTITEPDFFGIFVQRLSEISNTNAGGIVIGGMVTLLAQHIGVVFDQEPPMTDSALTLDALKKAEMIHFSGNKREYMWKHGPIPYCRLPNPSIHPPEYEDTFWFPSQLATPEGDEDEEDGDDDVTEPQVRTTEDHFTRLSSRLDTLENIMDARFHYMEDRLDTIYDHREYMYGAVDSILDSMVSWRVSQDAAHVDLRVELRQRRQQRQAEMAARRSERQSRRRGGSSSSHTHHDDME